MDVERSASALVRHSLLNGNNNAIQAISSHITTQVGKVVWVGFKSENSSRVANPLSCKQCIVTYVTTNITDDHAWLEHGFEQVRHVCLTLPLPK
jgi:hypothetical protein